MTLAEELISYIVKGGDPCLISEAFEPWQVSHVKKAAAATPGAKVNHASDSYMKVTLKTPNNAKDFSSDIEDDFPGLKKIYDMRVKGNVVELTSVRGRWKP